MQMPPISQLPWAVGPERFIAAGRRITGDGACCLFLIDESIPASARPGYAALVIAYARANEPVTILAGGAAAILIADGGVTAADAVARRLINQMGKLGLAETLRAGVAGLGDGVEPALDRARALAAGAAAGEVARA